MTRTNSKTKAPADVTELLEKWILTGEAYSDAHLAESVSLRSKNNYIGVPSVVLSGIVGTSIFASIQEAANSAPLKWLLVLLSISAGVFAALVTFCNYVERATRHKVASEEYMGVARQLEIHRTSITSMTPADWRIALEGYSQQLEAIGKRVDLPRSMIIISEVEREWKGMFPGGTRTELEKVETLIFPRERFPDELKELFDKVKA